MSYGISIINSSGAIIIDNTPLYTLEYGSVSVIPSGTVLFNTGAFNTKYFVRPTTIGASIWKDATGTLYTSTGTISFVELRENLSATLGAYGLAVYDSVSSIPSVVFSDAMNFVKYKYSGTLTSYPVSISMSATLSSLQHKYIDLDSLGCPSNSVGATSTLGYNTATFNADESVLTWTLQTFSYGSTTFIGKRCSSNVPFRNIHLNVAEC